MKTLVDENDIRIDLVNIVPSNDQMYAVFNINNNSKGEARVSINSCLDSSTPFRYYSKKTGVFDYIGVSG